LLIAGTAKNNDMGDACSTHEMDEGYIKLRGENHVQGLGEDRG
jgi:hypothetical protein